MAISKEEFTKENTYLESTLEKIDSKLKKSGSNISSSTEDLRKWTKINWSVFREFDKGEKMEFYSENDRKIAELERENKNLRKLYQIKDSPYFGKLTFNDEDIYIGITALKEEYDYLIYDWRAPICSMFYEYSLGPSSYEAPGGIEKGEISLKRQFKIKNREIKQVFDTNLNIDDELLQDVLAQHSSEKMKNIVNTIQVEQNEVIRDNIDKNLIVQGIAGSGKTSVALHRIAYLLYKVPELNSNNVLIFSPNDIFSEYISEVLPELGEENTLNTTYHEFAFEYLSEYDGVESYSAFVERYYKGRNQDNDLIKYKLSDDITIHLEKFVNYLKKFATFEHDLEYKKKVISKDELNDLLHERYANKPLFEIFNLIAEKLNNVYFKGMDGDKRLLLSKLFKVSNMTRNIKTIYKSFYASKIFKNNYPYEYKEAMHLNELERRVVNFEDASLIIYLKCLLEGFPYKVYVREVIVDEAQDYTFLQMKILTNIFKNADFTILGDINQTVNPFYKYDDLRLMSKLFKKSKYIELNKTYRSSKEIIEYSNKVLNLGHVSAIRKSTPTPVIKRKLSDIKHIGYDLKYLKDKYKSVAVITKSIDEANLLYEQFKNKYKNLSVIDITTSNYHRDLVIAPAYGIKGLEFDAVIIVNNFSSDKYLYYVAVTRAQHELIVYE